MANVQEIEGAIPPKDAGATFYSFQNVRVRQIRHHNFQRQGLIWKDVAPEEVQNFDRLSGQLGHRFIDAHGTFSTNLFVANDETTVELDEAMDQASGRPFVSVSEVEALFPVCPFLKKTFFCRVPGLYIQDGYGGFLSPKVRLGLKGNISALRQVPKGIISYTSCWSTKGEGPATWYVVIGCEPGNIERFETRISNQIYKQETKLWNSLDPEERGEVFKNGPPKKCVAQCSSGLYRPTLEALAEWEVEFKLIPLRPMGVVTMRPSAYYWTFDAQDNVSISLNIPDDDLSEAGSTRCECLSLEQLQEFREGIAGHDPLAEYRRLHEYDFSSILNPDSLNQLQEGLKGGKWSYTMVIPSKTLAIEFNFSIEAQKRKIQDLLKAGVEGISEIHIQEKSLWIEFTNRKMAEAAFEQSANWSKKICDTLERTGENSEKHVQGIHWNLPNRIKKAFRSAPCSEYNEATGEFRVHGGFGSYTFSRLEKKLAEQIENSSYYFEKKRVEAFS